MLVPLGSFEQAKKLFNGSWKSKEKGMKRRKTLPDRFSSAMCCVWASLTVSRCRCCCLTPFNKRLIDWCCECAASNDVFVLAAVVTANKINRTQKYSQISDESFTLHYTIGSGPIGKFSDQPKTISLNGWWWCWYGRWINQSSSFNIQSFVNAGRFFSREENKFSVKSVCTATAHTTPTRRLLIRKVIVC